MVPLNREKKDVLKKFKAPPQIYKGTTNFEYYWL